MGFLNFLKNFVEQNFVEQNATTEQTTTKNDLSVTDFEHLTKEGELPWGWHTHTKEFTNKINNEYSYFLNRWLESRTKSPLEQYSALKSFVVYLEDTERICKSKGECFEFWFYEILTSKDYIEKRKMELGKLTTNFDEIQSNYIKRNKEVSNLDERVIKTLKEHPNILQTDFIKLFDPIVQPDVREKLYWLDKSGKLERTKSGRSYVLHYKE